MTTAKTPRAATYAKLVAKHAALEAKIKEARKYAKLLAKSDALATQIAEARIAELAESAWPKVTAIMAEYDISRAELNEYVKGITPLLRSRGEPKSGSPKKVRKTSKVVANKYTDGVNFWTGRGLTPRWLRDALANNPTFTKEGFLIKG